MVEPAHHEGFNTTATTSGALNILVLGAGAVGGYIGARLQASGAGVTFLARGRRLNSLAENGLVIESPLGTLMRSRQPSVPKPGSFRF